MGGPKVLACIRIGFYLRPASIWIKAVIIDLYSYSLPDMQLWNPNRRSFGCKFGFFWINFLRANLMRQIPWQDGGIWKSVFVTLFGWTNISVDFVWKTIAAKSTNKIKYPIPLLTLILQEKYRNGINSSINKLSQQ